jgi:hypothetical protein
VRAWGMMRIVGLGGEGERDRVAGVLRELGVGCGVWLWRNRLAGCGQLQGRALALPTVGREVEALNHREWVEVGWSAEGAVGAEEMTGAGVWGWLSEEGGEVGRC